MKKILLCIAFLMAFTATAQELQWQWAKRGGGTKQAQGENSAYGYNSEQIVDIAIDQDNNYYFLAFITQQSTEFDGTPITVYNAENSASGNADILLISTDCEGSLRWTQTIGGATQDFAHKIVLDNNGGLYLGANIMNISGPSPNTYLPPHFSPDDAMPVLDDNNGEPQEGYKTTALLKYNTDDGSLVWRVMPQGDVNFNLRFSSISQLAIDSEGIIHAMIGFREGTHLEGELIVPDTTDIIEYYIIKFNSNGEVLSIMDVPFSGGFYEHHTDFRYDENLNRYYIAGFRTNGNSFETIPLAFNDIPFTEQAYIIAFDNMGIEVWRKEVSSVSTFEDNRIYDLEIDNESNLYLSGKYFSDFDNPGVSFGDYDFPEYLVGNVVYFIKFDSEGEVQWFTEPEGYNNTSSPNFFSGTHFAYDLLLRDNEVIAATQVSSEIWGDISVTRPMNHLADPALLRLNKNTGESVAVHDVMGNAGFNDAFTALAVDNDGNYVIGGYFYDQLFIAEDDNVPTLTKVQDQASYTDFFITKFASAPCGTAGVENFGYKKMRIYPNPATDIVTIDTPQTLNNYEVVNMLGQVLLKGSFTSGQNSISMQNLSAGTYIINITVDGGERMSSKIVKE